jgi:hypothetical protein
VSDRRIVEDARHDLFIVRVLGRLLAGDTCCRQPNDRRGGGGEKCSATFVAIVVCTHVLALSEQILHRYAL